VCLDLQEKNQQVKQYRGGIMSLLKFNYINGFQPEAEEELPFEQSEQLKLEQKLSTFEVKQTVVKEELENDLRIWRNKELSDSDWRIVEDAPGDTAAWKSYRTKLRDLPSNSKFPDKFEVADFPLAPGESSIPEGAEGFIVTNNDPLGIGTTSWVGNKQVTKTLKITNNEPSGVGTDVISVIPDDVGKITTDHIFDDGENAISITSVGSAFVTKFQEVAIASTDYAAGTTTLGINTESISTDNWIQSGSDRIAITGIGTENTITLAVGLAQTISNGGDITILKKDYRTISLASTIANAVTQPFNLRQVTTELYDQGEPVKTATLSFNKAIVNPGDNFDLTLTYTNVLAEEDCTVEFKNSLVSDFTLVDIKNKNGEEYGTRDQADKWITTQNPVSIITLNPAHKGVVGVSTLTVGIATNASSAIDNTFEMEIFIPVLGITTHIGIGSTSIS
tara:strand:- start:562 stop:1911 length:1350 start_codon:yes stop_codon:yes gene_type:complete